MVFAYGQQKGALLYSPTMNKRVVVGQPYTWHNFSGWEKAMYPGCILPGIHGILHPGPHGTSTPSAGAAPISAHLTASRVYVEASLTSRQCLEIGPAVWLDVDFLGILHV